MSEEPRVSISLASDPTLRRFLYSFSVIFLCLCVAVISISVYSNHWGYFGREGQHFLYNDRLAKVEYLKTIDQAELPEIYLLGSSAMLSFQPPFVENLFGMKTFNLGNFWGRAEEIWGWLNFIQKDLGSIPKVLIIGLEPWTFSNDDSGPPLLTSYRRRFVATEDLVKYAPHYSRARFQLSRLLDQLSHQNLSTLLKATQKHRLHRIIPSALGEPGGMRIDGTNLRYSKTSPESFLPAEVNDFYSSLGVESQRDAEEIEAERSALLAKQYVRPQRVFTRLPGDQLDREDVALFGQAMQLADDLGIEVGIIILPVHPYYRDLMIRATRYQTHIREIAELARRLQAEHANIRAVYDASDILDFKGDPGEFHDENHMTPINTERILEKLREAWRSS